MTHHLNAIASACQLNVCLAKAHRQAVRQTGRQAERQTDRQAGRETDGQTGRQAERQTDLFYVLLQVPDTTLTAVGLDEFLQGIVGDIHLLLLHARVTQGLGHQVQLPDKTIRRLTIKHH